MGTMERTNQKMLLEFERLDWSEDEPKDGWGEELQDESVEPKHWWEGELRHWWEEHLRHCWGKHWIEKDIIIKQFPFLGYVVSNIFKHADAAENHGVCQSPFLHDFHGEQGSILKKRIIFSNHFQQRHRYSQGVSLIYIVSDQNFCNLARLLVKDCDLAVSGGRYGNALQAACAQGHQKMVQLLLENGASVNLQGGLYGNALQAASYQGSVEIVRALLQRGANVNAHGGCYGPALQVASTHGRIEIVRMLLNAGADANSKN